MYDIQSIYQAKSVDDAIRALQADPSAIVIAGGTDVLIKIREGKLAGCSLVSIHNLTDELSGVTLSPGGDVEIGPLTTFRGVTFSDVIRQTRPRAGGGGGHGRRAPAAGRGHHRRQRVQRHHLRRYGLHPGGPGRGAAGAGPQGGAGRAISSGIRGWAGWPWPPTSCW